MDHWASSFLPGQDHGTFSRERGSDHWIIGMMSYNLRCLMFGALQEQVAPFAEFDVIQTPRSSAVTHGCSPEPSRTSWRCPGNVLNTSFCRRQTVAISSGFTAAMAPPSMGQFLSCQCPWPNPDYSRCWFGLSGLFSKAQWHRCGRTGPFPWVFDVGGRVLGSGDRSAVQHCLTSSSTRRHVGRLGQAELRRTSTRRLLTITSAATLINRNRQVAG